jgi:hypothetical protein
MAQSICLKEWNTEPKFTNAFSMVTKYTDLGSPDGKKSLLGVIFNVAVSTESTSTSRSVYHFSVSYRTGPTETYRFLTSFNNCYIVNTSNVGNQEYIKFFPTPVTNIQNVQLKINGFLRNDIGINDIGLIFRTYRTSNVASLDE